MTTKKEKKSICALSLQGGACGLGKGFVDKVGSFINELHAGKLPAHYTVTLSITHKVLLHASLQVPFGWLAELQLSFSPGKFSTKV